MTNEEAIIELKSDIELYDNEIVRLDAFRDTPDRKLIDALELAIKALEKAEKYKWHDLRKNPEDLPKNGYYDTWSFWHERYQNNRAFYDENKKRWLFHPDNNTGKPWVDSLSIIAWREIERFEEKK